MNKKYFVLSIFCVLGVLCFIAAICLVCAHNEFGLDIFTADKIGIKLMFAGTGLFSVGFTGFVSGLIYIGVKT